MIVDEQLNGEFIEEEERALTISSDEDIMNSDIEDDDDETPGNDMDIVSSDEEIDFDNSSIYDNSFHVKNISDILDNCRTIVNVINKSGILYEATQNLAGSTNKGHFSIDMRIRWHSTYKMLSKFIDSQLVLTQLMNELPKIKDVSSQQKRILTELQFSNEQWEIMKILNSALSLFSEASDMLSGREYPSYAVAYLVIDSLHHYFRLSTTNRVEQTIKHELNKVFDRYVNYSLGSSEHNLLLVRS